MLLLLVGHNLLLLCVGDLICCYYYDMDYVVFFASWSHYVVVAMCW